MPHPLSDEWEATVVNLAHAYRKMNDFDAAIEWYERALSLAPRRAGTHTALGFTHQLKGNFQTNMSEAIECYHRALGLRPDDTFAQEMLTLALIDQCAVTMPPYNFVYVRGPPLERFSGAEREGLGGGGRTGRAGRGGGGATRGVHPGGGGRRGRTTTWRCRREGRERQTSRRKGESRSSATTPFD